MITIVLLVALVGLLVWGIFTKWQKVADAWVARVGEITFFCGLLGWVLLLGAKVAF